MPAFTRKHYESIAQIIRDTNAVSMAVAVPTKERREHLADQFADMLEIDNPNFDRVRFNSACRNSKD